MRMDTKNSFVGAGRNNSQSGRVRLGCLGSLLLGLVVVVLVTAALDPWAFNIGGRFTPLNVWTGYGRLHSSAGATYGLYVRLMLTPNRGHGIGPRNNLRGSALLCTPQGITYPYDLHGNIKNAWSSTEGKETGLYFGTPNGEKPNRSFDLYGVWRNGELVLDDKGNLGHTFEANGTLAPKGRYGRAPAPGEHAAVALAYGSREEFEALCKSQVVGSR